MSPLNGIYGAGGFGRECLPLVRSADTNTVFIDDALAGREVNGCEVVSLQSFVMRPERVKRVAVAIADGGIRARLASLLEARSIESLSVRAPNSVILDHVELGKGAILSPFVTLTSNISIGRCFHANAYAYVMHDCVIGDFVTFAPGAKCNGNVVIEDFAYIGSGAVLKQGQPGRPLVIGRGALVGMGAVVTKDVPPGVTVVGNPARPLM